LKRTPEEEGFSFSIEPFFRYWAIEQSNLSNVTYAGSLIGSGYEPKNKTAEAGLMISFIF